MIVQTQLGFFLVLISVAFVLGAGIVWFGSRRRRRRSAAGTSDDEAL